MPWFVLACLAYLSVALAGSTLGLWWPSMRLGFHQPVGALGILLAFGVAASVMSSVATGRLMAKIRVGTLMPIATLVVAAALGEEALAPSLWAFAVGTVLFGTGFGALDSTLNAHAASHFGARDINWMHASYGLGATIGPLATTAALGAGLSWRWAYGTMAMGMTAVACLFAASRRSWAAQPTSVAGNLIATTRTVSLQVAASAVGAAALPAGIGIAIGALNAKVLAPLLLFLALAMGGFYARISALARRTAI